MSKFPERHHKLAFAFGRNVSYSIGQVEKSPVIMLMGDSHAGCLQYGLDVSLRDLGIGGRVVSGLSTQMFILSKPECKKALDQLRKSPEIEKVVLAQYWFTYLDRLDGSGKELYFQRLEEFARHVRSLGKTLYLLSDNPSRNFKPGDIAARLEIVEPRIMEVEWDGRQSHQDYLGMQGEINARIRDICNDTGAVYVPLHLGLLEDDFFPAFAKVDEATLSLYRDTNHLSLHGSLRAVQFIMPYIFPGKFEGDELLER